nr:hypothetical protein CFP56_00524 [Quercus suber]
MPIKHILASPNAGPVSQSCRKTVPQLYCIVDLKRPAKLITILQHPVLPCVMLLSSRIWLGNLLFSVIGSSDRPGGARISPGRLIKWPCQQTELEALLYVAANTTIPVPKVYRTYQYNGKLAIEMEYLRGCKTVQDSWTELLDQEKERAVEQVAGYIEQLRALQPSDKQRVPSTDGGCCRDIRVGTSKLFGPFADISKFHRFIRGGIPIESSHTVYSEKVAEIHTRDYGIRFTHGDLASLNILMRKGKVVALIDWECAGWYPEYWEYTKAYYNTVYQPEFHRMLDGKMVRYDDELEAERTLWERYDQFLDTVPPDVTQDVLNDTAIITYLESNLFTKVALKHHFFERSSQGFTLTLRPDTLLGQVRWDDKRKLANSRRLHEVYIEIVQVQKSAITTKTAIDQKQSLELVQMMLHSGANSSSDFFADGAFDEVYYETTGKSHSYLDYASGKAIKNLQSTKKSNHTKIQEKGAFVALEAGNLDALQVYIHPDEECRTNVLEQYTFKILYSAPKQNQRAPISLEVDSPGKVRTTVEDSSNALQALIRQLASLSSVLPVLPGRFISLKWQLEFQLIRSSSQAHVIDSMFSSTLEILSLQPLLQSIGANQRNALFPKSVGYAFQQDTDTAEVGKEAQPQPLALMETLNMNDVTAASTAIDETPVAGQFKYNSNAIPPPDGVINKSASRSSVAVKPAGWCLSRASNRIASDSDAIQRKCDDDAIEMGAALKKMMQPEQITQGDTQSQRLKPHESPTASSTTIVSPNRLTVSPLKSVATTFALVCKPKLLQHRRKALEQSQDRRRAEVRKRRPSKARGSPRSTAADIIDCQCGFMGEEGDMVGGIGRGGKLSLIRRCASQDSRLPEEHACYKCLLGEEDTPLSRRLTDLSLMRRGIHFAQEHGLTTQQQFGKDMGPIFVAFGRAGYVVDSKVSRKGSDAAKPRLVVVTRGPNHRKMLEELFSPMLHIAHYVRSVSAGIPNTEADAGPVRSGDEIRCSRHRLEAGRRCARRILRDATTDDPCQRVTRKDGGHGGGGDHEPRSVGVRHTVPDSQPVLPSSDTLPETGGGAGRAAWDAGETADEVERGTAEVWQRADRTGAGRKRDALQSRRFLASGAEKTSHRLACLWQWRNL